MDIFLTSDVVMPTVIGFCKKAGDFVIGHEAKKLRDNAKTGIVSFKQLSGETPNQVKKRSALWYYDADDNMQSVDLDQALKLYFGKLIPVDRVPRQYFVGIPSLSTNKEWLSRYKAKVTEAIQSLGSSEVQFVEEPLAVFDYYRSQGKLDDEKRLVMVIDVGGSTFNCCIIEQRGHGQSPRVLSLGSSLYGGTHLDKRLFMEALKDSPGIDSEIDQEEALAKRDPKTIVLLGRLEDAKIALSKDKKKGKTDSKYSLPVDAGVVSNDSFVLDVSQEHLKKAISHSWHTVWHHIVETVIEGAKIRLRRGDLAIGALLLAGGSARLPDMKPWALKGLHSYCGKNIRHPDVKDMEKAVALGIAAHCERVANSGHGRNAGSLIRYLTGSLYMAFRAHHAEDWQVPEIVGTETSGRIFSGGNDAGIKATSLDITLPFKPTSSMQVGVFTKDPLVSSDSQINHGDDVFRFAAPGVATKATVEIEFEEDGQVSVELKLKGKRRSGDVPSFKVGPYKVDDIKMVEGFEYIGLDFGHSNTFMAKLIRGASSTKKRLLPDFTVDKATQNRLKVFLRKVEKLKSQKILSREIAARFAESQIDEVCFQSSKLEKLDVVPPELQDLLNEDRRDESKDLKRAYTLMLEEDEGYRLLYALAESPLSFMRQVHGEFGKDWLRDAGKWRDQFVESQVEGHEYLAPGLIDVELRDLSDGYKSDREDSIDPIFSACKFHVAFEMIHPFSDGNGRIGRLLLDAMCIESGLPPVILSSDRREEYLDSLVLANNGDISDFVRIVLDHLEVQLDRMSKQPEVVVEEKVTSAQSLTQEMLKRMRKGENVVRSFAEERRKNAEDIHAQNYSRQMDQLRAFDEALAIGIESIGSGEEVTDHFEIIQVDPLTEESFKRFKKGAQDLKFTYKKLVHKAHSAITGKLEHTELYFMCEGESGAQKALSLVLYIKHGREGELRKLQNTNILVQEISFRDAEPEGRLSFNESCSLSEAVGLILVGAMADHSLPD